jgi:hypothetical protein
VADSPQDGSAQNRIVARHRDMLLRRSNVNVFRPSAAHGGGVAT